MKKVAISHNQVTDLADKLESLELDDAQAAALAHLLRRAAQGPEVEGFGVVFEIETTFKGTDEELQVWTDMRPLGRDVMAGLGVPRPR